MILGHRHPRLMGPLVSPAHESLWYPCACLQEANKLREGVNVVPRLVEGDPRDGLPLVCEQVGAVAVVVGSRGQGAVKRAFLGE